MKKIETSMENIGNDGKTYRNNRFLTGYFFPIPKKKGRKGQETDGILSLENIIDLPSWKHRDLFGVAL